MIVAFYAPMKPPDHPTHSGDRLIARLFLEALKRGGHTPALASRFRSFEGHGDVRRQHRLRAVGERLAARVVRRLRRLGPGERPDCWFTYHLYHKAPDWIGPKVCGALDIPYVVAEASVAPKQARGPWRDGFVAATDAIAGADLVVTLNRRDLPGLQSVVPDSSRLVHLKPFLDLSLFENDGDAGARARLETELGIPHGTPLLVTVAMMRAGAKLESYRVMAAALRALAGVPWHLLVVGDGAERPRVEAAFAPVAERVRFLGAHAATEVAGLLGACDLFVWPAVGEALGMAMLEAQAAGLAVVAGNDGGVADLVRDGETGRVVAPGDAEAFAAAVAELLDDPRRRQEMGSAARHRVRSEHALDAAGATLAGWLDGVTPGRARK